VVVEDRKHDWKANVYWPVQSWIDQGLLPRAATRDDWGVPVRCRREARCSVFCQFDAPMAIFRLPKTFCRWSWGPYWKDADTKLVHFIGKDNIVFPPSSSGSAEATTTLFCRQRTRQRVPEHGGGKIL
jgi:methionyl-tRNA synthetase